MRIDMIGARSIPARHGGLEVAAEELSVELVRMGHDVRALVDRAGGASDHAGVLLEGVSSIRTKHLHAVSQTLTSLAPVLRSRPDIAHFHGVGPGMFGLAVQAASIPTVVTVQGLDWERDKWTPAAQRAFAAGVRLTLGRADAVIAVSKAMQQAVLDRFGINAYYVPNGVRPPAPVQTHAVLGQLGLEPREYILFASRLVQEKGLHFLFDAYRALGTRVPLVVAGSGGASYADEYERRLRDSAPPGTIFAGFRSGQDLQELFAHARVYVLPSVMEGLPLSLLEAMSHGLPVIHSDIPECVEVTRGDAGVAFAVRDAPALADALQSVLGDDALSARLGASARARVASDYTWPSIAARVEDIYRRLV